MGNNQKKLIALGVLIVVFIGVSINSFVTVRKKIAKAKKSGQVQPKQFSSTTAISTVRKTPEATPTESISEQFGWGADPFSGRRIDVGGASGPALTVSGIVYNSEDPEDSYAIIDNSIVRIGDQIAGSKMKVTEITKDKVTLADGETKLELKVW